jgi:hypothetical protein
VTAAKFRFCIGIAGDTLARHTATVPIFSILCKNDFINILGFSKPERDDYPIFRCHYCGGCSSKFVEIALVESYVSTIKVNLIDIPDNWYYDMNRVLAHKSRILR